MEQTEAPIQTKKSHLILHSIIGLVVLIVFFLSYSLFLNKPKSNAEIERYSVSLSATEGSTLTDLRGGGFIANTWSLKLALMLRGVTIKSGGYKISQSMSPWTIAGIFKGNPYLAWVVIPEGLRKEEIGSLLQNALGWSDAEVTEWITKDTESDADHIEGVYFPDTYLIPVDELPADTAARLIAHFNTKFAPYLAEANKQNIKWTTALKLASIIQREAAGKSDMKLISGILWNRLDQKIALGVDSTIQYADGNAKDGWWTPPTSADLKVDSPFNSYLHTGLPPHPIDNPGTPAIDAALNPASTTCLYYLHDNDKMIHCADTYAEHQANIEKYLK